MQALLARTSDTIMRYPFHYYSVTDESKMAYTYRKPIRSFQSSKKCKIFVFKKAFIQPYLASAAKSRPNERILNG